MNFSSNKNLSSNHLISFFVASFRGGGAERVWIQLANQFSENGFQVDFLVAQAEGPYINSLSPNVRLVDLNTSHVSLSLFSLIRYLKHHKPTVFLSAVNHTNLVALFAKLLSFSSTKMFVSVHNNLSLSTKNVDSLKDKIIPFLTRILYPFADGILAVSCGVADDISLVTGINRSRINVIYNPVVTDDLFVKAKQPVDHPWYQSEQPPVILGVGRLVKQKNFSLLIKAFDLVRQKTPVFLVILGDGEERSKLQSLVNKLGINDLVSMPGFVENPYAYMAQSNILVLSSLWEGFGNVLVEALACGTSVISTNCESGPAEILEEGKYGMLVSVEDVDDLAEALFFTLNHPSSAEGLRSRSLDFTSQKIFERYYQVILPFLSNPI